MNRKCRSLTEQRQKAPSKPKAKKYAEGGMTERLVDTANNLTGWKDWEEKRPDYRDLTNAISSTKNNLEAQRLKGQGMRRGWSSQSAAVEANNMLRQNPDAVPKTGINYDQMRARLQAKQAGKAEPQFDNRDQNMMDIVNNEQARRNAYQNQRVGQHSERMSDLNNKYSQAGRDLDIYHTIDQEMQKQKIHELENRSAWDTMMDFGPAKAILSPLNTITGGLFEKAGNLGDSIGHGRLDEAVGNGMDLATTVGQLATNPVSTMGSNAAGWALQKALPQQQPQQFKKGGSVKSPVSSKHSKAFVEATKMIGKQKREKKEGGSVNMWMQDVHPKKGALHKSLGIPQDKKIPTSLLEKETHAKSPLMRKRANLALRYRGD